MDKQQAAAYSSNLDCHLNCDWHERQGGSVTCTTCGSGFSPETRKLVEEQYKNRSQNG